MKVQNRMFFNTNLKTAFEPKYGTFVRTNSGIARRINMNLSSHLKNLYIYCIVYDNFHLRV